MTHHITTRQYFFNEVSFQNAKKMSKSSRNFFSSTRRNFCFSIFFFRKKYQFCYFFHMSRFFIFSTNQIEHGYHYFVMIVDLLSCNRATEKISRKIGDTSTSVSAERRKKKIRFFKKLVISRELIFVNYCLFIAVYQWHLQMLYGTLVYEANGRAIGTHFVFFV